MEVERVPVNIIYEEVVEDGEQEFLHRTLWEWVHGRAPWLAEAALRREGEHRQWNHHDEEEEEEEEDPFWPGRGVPASRKAVEELRGTTWAAAGSRMQTECAVCLKDFEAEDKVSLMPCDHCFHQGCILEWLRVSRVCPLCRRALPTA